MLLDLRWALKLPLAAAQAELSDDFIPQEMGFMYRSLGSSTLGGVSLRFVVVQVRNRKNNKTREVVALLDDGSNLTVISNELADSLGAKGEEYAEFSSFGSGY